MFYSRAPHGCLPAPMLRIGKYTSVPSGVIMFKQVDINAPLDLVTNRIRSMPSGAGQRQCRVPVLSFCIYLSRPHCSPTFTAFFCDVMIAVFFSHLL